MLFNVKIRNSMLPAESKTVQVEARNQSEAEHLALNSVRNGVFEWEVVSCNFGVIQTPWGIAQSAREFAPGIVFFSTAGHGGYRLDELRYAEFCELGHFANFAKDEPRSKKCFWLEEDCNAALVYLRWPELATDEQLHDAVATARAVASWGHGTWLTLVDGWLDADSSVMGKANTILDRASQHARSVAHLWRRGSMSTRGRGWEVSFFRGDDRRDVTLKDYPAKRYYSDEELNELNIAEPVTPEPPKRSPFPNWCFVGGGDDVQPSDADPGL